MGSSNCWVVENAVDFFGSLSITGAAGFHGSHLQSVGDPMSFRGQVGQCLESHRGSPSQPMSSTKTSTVSINATH